MQLVIALFVLSLAVITALKSMTLKHPDIFENENCLDRLNENDFSVIL